MAEGLTRIECSSWVMGQFEFRLVTARLVHSAAFLITNRGSQCSMSELA